MVSACQLWSDRAARIGWVPFDHGRWLAARLPSAKAKLFPEEGHLSIAVDKCGEIIGELVASAPTVGP
jgi:hypothetical protein